MFSSSSIHFHLIYAVSAFLHLHLRILRSGLGLDTFTVTCLTTPQHMESYPAGKNIVFDGEVKDTWTKCVLKGDAVLAKPEDYMTLR